MNNKELYDKVLQASEKISLNSRNPDNFMIVSPKLAELLENLDIKKYRKKKIMKINEISKNL